jgi:hypothetical protein
LDGDVSISTFWGRGNFITQLTGTWAGTIVFEASMDGSTYVTLPALNIGTNTVVTSTTGNGTFVVNGTVPEDTEFFKTLVASTTTNTLSTLDNTLFNKYSTLIFNKINQDGLDLNRITINGRMATLMCR